MSESHLFPDTNVFLHFEFFDSIDWCTLAGSEKVALVLTATVIRELDRHKNNPRQDQKLRERARKVVRRLYELEKSSRLVRPGVTLERWGSHPPEVRGLSLEDPDECHIAAALHFAQERAIPATLVTGDLGMLLKAGDHGLAGFEVPETFKLKELDERDVEIKKLREELTRIQTRSPKLKVTFQNGEPFQKVTLRPQSTLSNAEIEALVSGEVRPEIWDSRAHERQLRKHYGRVREYQERKNYTFKLDLVLQNEGEALADDVDIFVTVPEAFVLSVEEEKEPEKPDPPNIMALRSRDLADFEGARLAGSTLAGARGWDDSGEQEAQFWLRRLKQGADYPFPPLFLRPRDRENRKGFQVKVVVTVGEPSVTDEFELGVTFR